MQILALKTCSQDISKTFTASTRVGISGTTAKSCKRKFVPSSHTGLSR